MFEQISIFVIFIIYASISVRVAGGGFCPHPAGTGEAMLAVAFSIVIGLQHEAFLPALLCFLWVFLWFQTGHGTAFQMGQDPATAQSGRKSPLSYVIDPLCKALGRPLGGVFYCWAFMGLKGFLMHLPLGPWAFVAAILWPSAYWVGHVLIPRHKGIDGGAVAELVAGAFSGAVLAAYVMAQ